MSCTVNKCRSKHRNSKELSFFRFPKDPELCRLWVQFCNRDSEIKLGSARICSLHFKPDDFEDSMQQKMGFYKDKWIRLKTKAIPTVLPESNEHCTLDIAKEIKIEVDVDGMDGRDLEIINLRSEIDSLKKEIDRFKEREKAMQYRIGKLKMKNSRLFDSCSNIENTLRAIFTEGQIKKLKKCAPNRPPMKQHWAEADIANSMALYTASSKAYKLLKKNKFPLPSIRTLQRWAQKKNTAMSTTSTNENETI